MNTNEGRDIVGNGFSIEQFIVDQKELIDKSEVVSFDIFDTCIVRCLNRPTDVFKLIEYRTGSQCFYEQRIAAEQSARVISGEEDISLVDIYRLLPEYDYAEFEVQVEMLVCFANREIKSLYDYASDNDKKIIFVSDMYLPEDSLKSILDRSGYSGYSRIWVSSRYKETKAMGTLFDRVIQELNVLPQSIHHIGDNYVADVELPRSKGISASHYVPPRERSLVSKSCSIKTLDASMHFGLLANGIAAAQEKEYWWRLGYGSAGYIILAFCRWLYKSAKAQGISRLYFLSRDGEIIKRVFNLLYPEFDTRYMYSSRRMLLLASLYQLDDMTLDALSRESEDVDALGLLQRLGLGGKIESQFNLYLKENPLTKSRKSAFHFFRDFLKAHEEELVACAKRERQELLDYFENLDFGRQGDAVVDIGWGLSSEEYLRNIARVEGLELNYKAFYFGSRAGAYDSGDSYSFFFNHGMPYESMAVVFNCVEIVEYLFAGTHASVNRIESGEPLFCLLTGHENERLDSSRLVHQGVVEYVQSWLKLERKLNCHIECSREMVFALLDQLIRSPSLEDVKRLGGLQHSVFIGSKHYQPLVPAVDLFDGTLMQKIRFILSQSKTLWPCASWLVFGHGPSRFIRFGVVFRANLHRLKQFVIRHGFKRTFIRVIKIILDKRL